MLKLPPLKVEIPPGSLFRLVTFLHNFPLKLTIKWTAKYHSQQFTIRDVKQYRGWHAARHPGEILYRELSDWALKLLRDNVQYLNKQKPGGRKHGYCRLKQGRILITPDLKCFLLPVWQRQEWYTGRAAVNIKPPVKRRSKEFRMKTETPPQPA